MQVLKEFDGHFYEFEYHPDSWGMSVAVWSKGPIAQEKVDEYEWPETLIDVGSLENAVGAFLDWAGVEWDWIPFEASYEV